MRPVAEQEQAGPGFGASPAAGAAVGAAETLTFLFTDIEGSTALLRRVGEGAYAQVLAGHHAIIRSGLAAHGGREVDTQGDAFFVVFSSPGACMAAVLEMQRALEAHAGRPGSGSGCGWGCIPVRRRGWPPAWWAWMCIAPPGWPRSRTGARCWCRRRRPRWCATRCRRARRWPIWACTG